MKMRVVEWPLMANECMETFMFWSEMFFKESGSWQLGQHGPWKQGWHAQQRHSLQLRVPAMLAQEKDWPPCWWHRGRLICTIYTVYIREYIYIFIHNVCKYIHTTCTDKCKVCDRATYGDTNIIDVDIHAVHTSHHITFFQTLSTKLISSSLPSIKHPGNHGFVWFCRECPHQHSVMLNAD